MAERTLNTHEGINGTLISDCNDAIIPGISYYANDNTINKPTSGWFHVNCINRLNNYLTQIAIAMNISSNSPMWIRTNDSNHNWSSWQKILTSPVFKSDGNLNDLYQTGHSGIYFLNGDKSKFQNSPTGWCILIVLAFGEVAFQLIFKREEIYVRDRTGNPLAWGSWSKATMTYV